MLDLVIRGGTVIDGTGGPAQQADVGIDGGRIVDRATYERPFVPPEGLRDCFVNGTAVLRNGDYTGARPGRVLRGGR